MGSRGPVPKRSDQRLGHRAKSEGESIVSAPAAHAVEMPPASESWHQLARDWYESLGASGQRSFYEPSDWQTARVWAEVLSLQLLSDKLSAVMIQAWAGSAAELLTTEGSRRRAQVELQRARPVDEDEEAAVASMDAYRAKLG